jgi:sensor histidine kinase YesM
MLSDIQHFIEENPGYRFWFWQVGFWFFMCVVGFFTLILWYSQVTAATVGHVILQAIVGLLCTIFLHKAFFYVKRFALGARITSGLALILFTAFVWTVVHMEIFVMLTGWDTWDQFGGWYFSSIFVFMCWTGLFLGIRYYELLQSEHRIMLQAEATSREEHLKRVKAQSEARDAKLKMLRYQLNPHFLCNTLNAVNSLIEVEEREKAQNMTVQLSEFLRYSLDNDPDTKIPLCEEVEALNLYLAIEKTRFDERLTINMDIADKAEMAIVPSLLLQPIIENSMKHAIAKSENGGAISIKAEVLNDLLILTLKDTGDGLSKHASPAKSQHDEKPNNKSVGLENTRQRLKAIYNDSYRIETYFEQTGGLTTIISIPAEYV